MSEKSYVGMTRCFYCGEHSEILLDRRLRNSLPRDCGVINMRPCPKCEGYMQQGIIVIVVDSKSLSDEIARVEHMTFDEDAPMAHIPNPSRTGVWLVVKEDALRRVTRPEMMSKIAKHRWTFMDAEVAERLGVTAAAIAENREASGERSADASSGGA